MPRPVVVLDLGAGEARVGGTTVVVSARPGGALVVGDQMIRPLSFGERWRLLDGAAGTGNGGGAGVGPAVLACAAEPAPDGRPVDPRPMDDAIGQVMALHLAGARPERTVPGFGLQLARLIQAGWTPRDVLDADADLVDLLTTGPDGDITAGDDGWTSIFLAAPEPAAGSVIESLRLLERDLVARLTTPAPDQKVAAATQPAFSETPDGRSAPRVEPVGDASEVTTPWDDGPGGRSHRGDVFRHPPSDPSAPAPAPAAATTSRPPAGAAAGAPTAADAPPVSLFVAADARAAGAAVSADRLSALRPVPPDRTPDAFPAPIRSAAFAPMPDVFANHTAGTTPYPAPIGFGSERPVREAPGAAAGRATLVHSTVAPSVVQPDAVASRVAPDAAPGPDGPDVFDIADRVAALLDEESDLRGLRG